MGVTFAAASDFAGVALAIYQMYYTVDDMYTKKKECELSGEYTRQIMENTLDELQYSQCKLTSDVLKSLMQRDMVFVDLMKKEVHIVFV